MTTVSEAMQVALAHMKAGELQNTEHICRQVLEVDPRHAPAVNLLGLVALQQGCFDIAAQWFGQAINLGPATAIYYAHLGEAFRGLGRLDDAAASYGQALRIEPDWAE